MKSLELLISLLCLTQTGCGLSGLYASIPPYEADDDVGQDEDAGGVVEGDVLPEFDLEAPANLRANGSPQGVELQWDAVEGASGYEVRVEGAWFEAGSEPNYLDEDAPLGSLAGTLVAVASDATAREHVALTATSNLAAVPGASRTYLVRATRTGEFSPSSVEVTGARAPGTITYTWRRAADEPATSFEDLTDSDGLNHTDPGAKPDGSRSTYRVVARAEGAESEVVSNDDEGWRLAAVQVAVGAAHSCALLSNGVTVQVEC